MNEPFDPRQDSFRLNPRYRLQWEEAQGCHVLLYPEGLIKLNDSAAEILRRCQAPTTCHVLVSDLRQAFPGAEGLDDDVAEFLVHAAREEWIQPAG